MTAKLKRMRGWDRGRQYTSPQRPKEAVQRQCAREFRDQSCCDWDPKLAEHVRNEALAEHDQNEQAARRIYAKLQPAVAEAASLVTRAQGRGGAALSFLAREVAPLGKLKAF
jgi:hypothetical protein